MALMLERRKVVHQDSKLNWPFKLLLAFIAICLIAVVLYSIQSKFALIVHGENGRGTVTSEEYLNRHETTSVLAAEPKKYQNQEFTSNKSLLDVTILLEHVSVGQNVPIVIHQDVDSVQCFVGTKSDVILSMVSELIMIVFFPIYFMYKYKSKKIVAF